MLRKSGTAILLLSAFVTAYGAVAFFLINSLPPNGGGYGRLPSLYVFLGGMGGMLLGVTIRRLHLRAARK